MARAYGLVLAATLCYTCLMFVWFSLPASLSTVIADLGLTGTQAGLLTGAVPLTYVPLALFSGLVVDRVGPARSLAAGVVVFGLAQVGRSVAAGFPAMLALTLAVGVGATTITFGLPKLVSLLFPPESTGFPSAVYLVGAQTGTAAAFALARPVLGPALGGWRPLFFWSGLVAVGYAVVWAAVAWAVPVRGVAGADGDSDGRGDVDGEAREFSVASVRRDLGTILSHRQLRYVVVVGAVYLFVLHGMQGWLPTVLQSRGLAAGVAGRTTSLLVAANVTGVLAVPTVADAYAVRREAIVACGAVVVLGVACLIGGATGPATVLGVVATGFGVGGLSPLVRAIPPEYEAIGPRLTGTAVGFVFAVGEVGGFLGPVAVGTSRDLTGSYAPGLALLACGGVAVVLAGHRMADV